MTLIKLQHGGYRFPVNFWCEDNRLYFQFPYNKGLKDEIKAMEGARWEPARKVWHVANSARNQFQLAYLRGENPYRQFDDPLNLDNIPTVRFNRIQKKELPIYPHQREGAAHILQRRQCIIAGEMGTGKSLMMGLALEQVDTDDAVYVGPRSALYSVQRDFEIWGVKPLPKLFLTYEGMVKMMKEWISGTKAPRIILFDEASRLKSPTTQRSQAAMALANGVRNDWGDRGIIALLSGTPAPKSPADWWSLAEIARPGFLKEGDIFKFKNRLGIIVQKEGIDGGSYPQLVTWRNDDNKCNICGQLLDHENHLPEFEGIQDNVHHFVPSVNEVANLYRRLKGLVVVYFKKDCLNLPEKNYRIIEVKAKPSTLRAAKLITQTSKTTIEGLTKLRELSDGFQYVDTAIGKGVCPLCKGAKKINHLTEIPGTCPNCPSEVREGQFDIGVCGNHVPQTIPEIIECTNCGGSGEVTKYEREIKEVSCPKDEAFLDLLDEFDDVGRVIAFGGFTGTIDRMVNLARRKGWYVIRMDQGQIKIYDPKGIPLDIKDFQKMFQEDLDEYDNVIFIAHPESGGMGLTLTASPVCIYFSNTFKAESRIQSEDRIHRPGMDHNRGATIIDIFHLPTDKEILDNLKRKRDLQAMSLGEFSSCLKESDTNVEVR